jgi:hypothetical protein
MRQIEAGTAGREDFLMPSHESSVTMKSAVSVSIPKEDLRAGVSGPGRTVMQQANGQGLPSGGEEKRRSQRVLVRIRAEIHFNLHGKAESANVHTLSVNPFGAMLVSPRNLPTASRLVLEHGVTRDKVACRVVRPAKEMAEGFHIPVEFDTPAPLFWKIGFPPEDWNVHDGL